MPCKRRYEGGEEKKNEEIISLLFKSFKLSGFISRSVNYAGPEDSFINEYITIIIKKKKKTTCFGY